MSAIDTRRLAHFEGVIERGMQTFVEVGSALLAIRDERLYRAEHGTFEEYCSARWDFTPQHAGRLIVASQVVKKLEPIGSTPRSESVARELAPVLRAEPEAVAEVWADVIEEHGPEPTAKQTAEVVSRHLAPAPTPVEPTQTERATAKAYEVREELAADFHAARNFGDAGTHLGRALTATREVTTEDVNRSIAAGTTTHADFLSQLQWAERLLSSIGEWAAAHRANLTQPVRRVK